MFVVNFDFSGYEFWTKLAAINIPVILTELLTYPLQRLQTQLISRERLLSGSQLREIPLLLGEMWRVDGFPRCFHGLRYSLDYSVTQMTFKFFLFDHLMVTDWAERTPIAPYVAAVLANAAATIASQSAFSYQTIASSLDPNPLNTTENLRQRLVAFTARSSPFKTGLKYTVPVSAINSLAEIFLIVRLQALLAPASIDAPPISMSQEMCIAASVVGATSLTQHWVVQRQVELCLGVGRMGYLRGLSGTLLRNMGKGLGLYLLYMEYFEWRARKEVEGEFAKRQVHNVLPSYYQGRRAL